MNSDLPIDLAKHFLETQTTVTTSDEKHLRGAFDSVDVRIEAKKNIVVNLIESCSVSKNDLFSVLCYN